MKALLGLGLILISFGADLILGQDGTVQPIPTKQWFMKPWKEGHRPGNVAVQSSKGQQAELTANKETKQVQTNVQGRGQWNAGTAGNGVVQAKNPKGMTATGDQSKKNPSNGLRTADAGQWHGELKNKKSTQNGQEVQEWDSSLPKNGKYFNGDMEGKGTKFVGTGNRGNTQELKPNPGQTKTGGSGTITRNKVDYKYTNSRTADGNTEASMTNLGKGPTTNTYNCKAQKGAGVSLCTDAKGQEYGKVVEQPDGTVIVYKSVVKGVSVPVGKAKVIKNQNGKSVATVNDGMFQGQAGNTVQRDCMADYGKTGGSKIKVAKPIVVKYNSESKDGRRVFQFPDCVTMGATITLPPGVDVNRLAVQYDINVLPAGKLKCVDQGSCNKDCYYCNFCTNERKVDILANANGDQTLCNVKGGGTYPLSVTACPPPAQFEKGVCSGFTKSDGSYWKKKGDVQARMLFWERSPNEKQVKDTYYRTINGNAAAKQLLKIQFAVDNKAFVNANNPTDFDLAEYYVKKNAKPAEELVGCVEGLTNYTVSSQKVSTSFLLEAGSVAAAPKSLFDTKPCPQVDKINQAQADSDAAEAKQSAPAKAPGWGNFGNIGNFFGGGR